MSAIEHVCSCRNCGLYLHWLVRLLLVLRLFLTSEHLCLIDNDELSVFEHLDLVLREPLLELHDFVEALSLLILLQLRLTARENNLLWFFVILHLNVLRTIPKLLEWQVLLLGNSWFNFFEDFESCLTFILFLFQMFMQVELLIFGIRGLCGLFSYKLPEFLFYLIFVDFFQTYWYLQGFAHFRWGFWDFFDQIWLDLDSNLLRKPVLFANISPRWRVLIDIGVAIPSISCPILPFLLRIWLLFPINIVFSPLQVLFVDDLRVKKFFVDVGVQ